MKDKIKKWTAGFAALALISIGGTAHAGWETEGLTDSAIKVGVMGPFTGNASSYSKTQIGLMAYFKHINDQGGIHGRKFEIIAEDTACAPAKGIAAAKNWSTRTRYFTCTATRVAVSPWRLSQLWHLLVSPGSSLMLLILRSACQ